jgi:hypothetical protein
MFRIAKFISLTIVLLTSGYQSIEAQSGRYTEHHYEKYGGSENGAFIVDAGGRPIKSLEVGSSLHVGARGLRPTTMYEFRLGTSNRVVQSLKEAFSFARSSTDREGSIPPFVLWYESGVVGCSQQGVPKIPVTFRSFEEAERALIGKVLTVSVHPVERDTTGRVPPQKLRVGEAEFTLQIPVARRRNPAVYASDPKGCLLNSQLTGNADLYVSGLNFKPGEVLKISVVPNQRGWRVGDPINDITGASFAAKAEKVAVDSAGRFTVKVWNRANQQRGVYDIIAHRLLPGQTAERFVRANDIISYAAETGFILYLLYPVGGPTMDLAGRPISGSPYFEFADSFADTDDPVWGAVDPTYVPTSHPGGTYAAYYVVNHRSVAGWDPAMGGSIDLVDVTGGIEVHPVKAGCINGTDVIIWNSPLTVGQYDVVVDFGSTAATLPATYVTDGHYNDVMDFLDGADQIGFVVAPDPYAFGSFPIGQDSYSQDDFFPSLGAATDVDLRAEVRYPATSTGVGTPVATGQHPLFIIEHGNHSFCSTPGSYTHATCPSRKPNHMGYMGLLERLASHGIIAVSIDAYDLTGPVPQWISERSDLILKHLELWSHMNNTATFVSYPDFFAGRFANHVDMTKISVSGHSRGGEASVGAYMRNALLASPFNIVSVSSLAPVDGQSYVLPDVPYFVILPAADGDVSNLSGMRIYDRAGSGLPTPDGTTKSGIDVYGASHNFFNTVWAADVDDGAPGRDDYIPAADQQRLGETYLIAWARIHLNSEVVYEDLFRGKLSFPSIAGRKIYPFRHEKSHSKIESGGGGSAVASGGATVASVSSPSVHQTQALRVVWTSSSAQITYTVPLGQRDASSFEVLSFRAAQTNSALNPASGNQDFQVELIGGGHTKATYVGRFGAIPKPYNRSGTDQNVMTTIRIPLHSFIMNHSGVTLDNIDTIRIKFTNPTSGEIYADDIEFSR